MAVDGGDRHDGQGKDEQHGDLDRLQAPLAGERRRPPGVSEGLGDGGRLRGALGHRDPIGAPAPGVHGGRGISRVRRAGAPPDPGTAQEAVLSA